MAKKTKVKKAKVKTVKAKKAKKTKKAVKKVAAFRPPYKCQRTLVSGVCLKYRYNATNGQYDLGGDRVSCAECEYFF